MANFEQLTGTGLFVGTTNVWDTNQVYAANIDNPQLEELLVRLYQNICDIAITLNLKDSGLYFPQEFVNGQVFFPNPNNSSKTQTVPAGRQNTRMLVICGSLPNSGTKSIPHGIPVTSSTTVTRIFGGATDPVSPLFIGLPYASASGNNIEVNWDNTNVNIITNSNRTNFTISYVILEYLQT